MTKEELAAYGDELLGEFAGVIANVAVARSLEFEAERNEALAMQNIAAAGAANSVYVTPHDIPAEQQAYIAKASVNAHLQKAQAMQVAAYTDKQVHLAELRVKEKFRGLKVTAQAIITKPWPVDTCWRDKYGRYHMNEHGPRKVKGYIEDIDLKKDFIIIRPTRVFKAINNSVQFHRVYMVQPDSMKPLVTLDFSWLILQTKRPFRRRVF